MRGSGAPWVPRRTGKAPATADKIVAMARLSEVRDRALLLIGFAGAFRRSELVAWMLRTSRRRPRGSSSRSAAARPIRKRGPDPSRAVRSHARWRRSRRGSEPPISPPAVFRPVAKGERLRNGRLTDRSVAKIAKAHAVRVGLDPAVFAGHSLRSGFLTSAAARGASIFKMADQSRHRSMDTLRRRRGARPGDAAAWWRGHLRLRLYRSARRAAALGRVLERRRGQTRGRAGGRH